MITPDDIAEFAMYLRQCTDAQVQGVYDCEMKRGGDGPAYAELAVNEARARNIELNR